MHAAPSQLLVSSSINKEPTVCQEQCWTLVTTAIVWSLSGLPPDTCHSNCIYIWVPRGEEVIKLSWSGHPRLLTSAL